VSPRVVLLSFLTNLGFQGVTKQHPPQQPKRLPSHSFLKAPLATGALHRLRFLLDKPPASATHHDKAPKYIYHFNTHALMHAEGRSNISPLRVAVEPPLFRPAKLPECISRTSSGLQGLGVIFCPCSKSLLAFQTSKNLTQSQLSGGGGLLKRRSMAPTKRSTASPTSH
jgi:hypothetical protein